MPSPGLKLPMIAKQTHKNTLQNRENCGDSTVAMFSRICHYRELAKRATPTMKVMKVIQTLFCILIMSSTARAYVLFEDASNYPYANGTVEGQGQWYCYYPAVPYHDATVTNNVLLLNITNNDSVATPISGWTNQSGINYASFMINVSQLPVQNSQFLSENGEICQLQNKNDAADVCHVFIDTRSTSVPGTYQLGIAGFDPSLAAFTPPSDYPMDLATDVWYNVVVLYDTNQTDAAYGLDGATLWVNPSLQDYTNDLEGVGFGQGGIGTGYVNPLDQTENTNLSFINVSQIGFSPNVDAGISNIIVGTEFSDVLRTNPPVFGIQPQSGTVYLRNSFTLYAVASGADLTYQWRDASGPLSDNSNYTGSTNDTLVVTNLSVSDTYVCVVTDAYGATATSLSAAEMVITTPTPVFFQNETPVTNYANEYTTTGFTNVAAGTGPISYQWYFAPASSPTAYSLLHGQTGATLTLSLDTTNVQGNYYVAASTNGVIVAVGPTNTLVEPPPLSFNMSQLHALVQSYSNQIAANPVGTVYIGTNNVTVTGYVAQFNGFGSTWTEYYIQDASGLGVQVHLEDAAEDLDNSSMPSVGTCVTVTGQLEVVHNQIAIVLNDSSGITIVPTAPSMTISPTLANGLFNGFVTNGLGTNAFLYNASLVTLTNVYIYGDRNGDPVANGGAFFPNSYSIEYVTAGGPYNAATGNTNMLELYQFGYDYPISVLQSEFDNAPIPTNCFQLTGIYVDYDGVGKLEPSRLADYVVSRPSLAVRLTDTNGTPKVFWPLQIGSTYSLYSATNLDGPWVRTTGLAYYPTNVVPFTDTNRAPAKFYYITSP